MIVYGSAEPLHENLLKFTTHSGKTVTHEGKQYRIEHCQFGTYNIQEAFSTVVEETDLDPRSFDGVPAVEFEKAIKKSAACIDDRDIQSQFHKREYIDSHDFRSAVSSYQMIAQDSTSTELGTVTSNSRVEAIAEVFSYMHADRASLSAFLPFGINPPYYGDDEDDSKPNEGLDHSEIKFSLRDTAMQLHGPSVFKQPDPSIHTTRALYKIYDQIGIEQQVRDMYGILVSPIAPSFYWKNDSEDDSAQYTIGRSVDAMTGMGDTTGKWEDSTAENGEIHE